MGRIAIRKEAPRPTEQHAGSPADYSGIGRSMSETARANNYLAHGLRSVGDALFDIGMREKANDISADVMAAQAKRIELRSALMQGLNDDLQNGKYQRREDFEKALNDGLDTLDKDMAAWSKDNARWQESATRIDNEGKLDRARATAEGMGTYLRVNMERTQANAMALYNVAFDNGDFESLKSVVGQMTWLSGEQRGALINRGKLQCDKVKLGNLHTQLDAACLAGDVNLVKNICAAISTLENHDDKTKEAFSGLFIKKCTDENDKRVLSEMSSLAELGDWRGVYKLSKNLVGKSANETAAIVERLMADNRAQSAANFVKAAVENIPLSQDDIQKASGDAVADAIKKPESTERSMADWAARGLEERADADCEPRIEQLRLQMRPLIEQAPSREEKDKLKLMLETAIGEIRQQTRKAYFASAYTDALSLFNSALENDGQVRKDLLSPALLKLQAAMNDGTIDSNAANAKVIDFVAMARSLREVFDACNAYKKANDPTGVGLLQLMFRTQGLDNSTRKICMEMLGRRVRGEKDGSPWGARAEEAFNIEFDKACSWFEAADYEAEGSKGKAEDKYENRIAYYAFRDDFVQRAKAAGMTPVQAMEQLKIDPFYKRMLEAEGDKLAAELLKDNIF